MKITVLIPSHGRPDKLRRCLNGLAQQTRSPSEIIVGLDGGSEREASALLTEYGTKLDGLRVLPLPKLGYIPTRATLLAETQSDLFLSLNDDVRTAESLVEAHIAAHQANTAAIVTGPAPWVTPINPNLFDRLVAESNLIFFDPIAELHQRGRLTFRHCVGLNFSCQTQAARDCGGFHDLPHAYGYDDIELAYRVGHSTGASIDFAPTAIVQHDHRYEPQEVMRREYKLGRAAWMYHQHNPAFTRELFQRDISSPAELDFCRQTLTQTRTDAERIEMHFLELSRHVPDAVSAELIPVLAQSWVPLKRFLWRWGLLDEANATPERFTLVADAPALV